MKTVYRIEDESGLGPFSQYDPVIDSAPLLFKNISIRHTSMERWMGGYIPELVRDHKYRVLELIVSDYQCGEYQTLYTKESVLKTTEITSAYTV